MGVWSFVGTFGTLPSPTCALVTACGFDVSLLCAFTSSCTTLMAAACAVLTGLFASLVLSAFPSPTCVFVTPCGLLLLSICALAAVSVVAGVPFHVSAPLMALIALPMAVSSVCNGPLVVSTVRCPSFASVTLLSGWSSTAADLCCDNSSFVAFSFSIRTSSRRWRSISLSIISRS